MRLLFKTGVVDLKGYNKKIWLKYSAFVLVFSAIFASRVFADGDADCVDTVDTVLFGTVCGSEGISKVLELVINVLNIGVGILGVIGIMVTGIQYLTAGSSEEQTKKAKRRLTEIVIGLAAYAVLSVFVGFLTGTTSTTAELANISSISSSSFSGGNSVAGKGKWERSGNKIYYKDENGKIAKGRQKINGANYYFNKKTGALKTGFVKVKKNGKTSIYYYKKGNGKQVFGTAKIYGPYNGTKNKDTWYFNKKTGKLEGVKLAVPQITQTGYNCGPTSMLEIRGYYKGTKPFSFDGQSYAWNDEASWAAHCGTGSAPFDNCASYLSARWSPRGMDISKNKLVGELFSGRPFIFSVGSCGQTGAGGIDPCATNPVFTSGGGHFMTISGYYKNQFFIKDPANRQTVTSWDTLHGVANGYDFFIPSKKLR